MGVYIEGLKLPKRNPEKPYAGICAYIYYHGDGKPYIHINEDSRITQYPIYELNVEELQRQNDFLLGRL